MKKTGTQSQNCNRISFYSIEKRNEG